MEKRNYMFFDEDKECVYGDIFDTAHEAVIASERIIPISERPSVVEVEIHIVNPTTRIVRSS